MRERLRLQVRGAVQGVGFRPFVFRLARAAGLDGFVANDAAGVVIEVEGPRSALRRFLDRLAAEVPAPAVIESVEPTWLPAADHAGFRIETSREQGAKTAQMLPDVATCRLCLAEVRDAADRRAGYPFTNCTHCGPRFSIILGLPYDRPQTTMRGFRMCTACRTEYDDPRARRFHAQPNACPACGPRLRLWDAAGRRLARDDAALRAAAEGLRAGRIVAVKGLGGFHLMVDAADAAAVARLRAKKPRREKPLALMLRDLAEARRLCEVDATAAELLASAEAPILLLPRRADAPIDDGVAPGNAHLGVMLPYTPLHHLLLEATRRPVVATSGNLSEEPICTDEREAQVRLAGIADLLLVHDRPIARHVDDSVAWVLRGEARLLRRARGYSPRPVRLAGEAPTLLAVGAHLKNAIALGVGSQVFVSQHIGDMETPQAIQAFERVIADFLALYGAAPVAVAHDQHPDYVTTRWARGAVGVDPADATPAALCGLPLIAVQHHHAHLASCLAENGFHGTALGVTWDGTGHGPDGTIWGGEFLLGDAADFRRVAHLRRLRLLGGERAIREPRRTALALLWELGGARELERDSSPAVRSFAPGERRVLARMLERGVHAPRTSSAGRLFDGVAALVGLHQQTTFEGQAAMALEQAADPTVRDAYRLPIAESESAEAAPLELDWRPLVAAVLDDVARGEPVGGIAARFHNGLVRAIVEVARRVGASTVALSGGCFQNRLLVERTVDALEAGGFTVLLHRHVPPNDGGISLGQLAVAAARLAAGER